MSAKDSLWVDVWLGHPPWGPFTYQGNAHEGEIVWIPLQQRVTYGVVFRTHPHPPSSQRYRPLLRTTGVLLPSWVLHTIDRLHQITQRPPGYFFRFALPPGPEKGVRIHVRPTTHHLPSDLEIPSRLREALKGRRWRSWKRLHQQTGVRHQDLWNLVEAGWLEVRTVIPHWIQNVPPTPKNPIPQGRVGVRYGLSWKEKERWLRETCKDQPVFLWCSDHSLARFWANRLGWPLYTSEQTPRDRFRIWIQVLQGELCGVVGTHAGFLLPFPAPHIVIDEPWMEGFFFQEPLRLLDVISALPVRRTLLLSGVSSPWTQSSFTLLRRYPERSPRWEVTPLTRIQSKILRAVEQGRNVAIWVERKGYGYLRCVDCRRRLRCPIDDSVLRISYLPVVKVTCPTCGYTQTPPRVCPSCGGEHLKVIGRGLEYVARMVKNWIPEARILRVHADLWTPRTRHLLHHVWNRGGADVLVGTWAARTAFIQHTTHLFVVWYPETFFFAGRGEQDLAQRFAWLTWMRPSSPAGVILTRRYDLALFKALQKGTLRTYFQDLYRDLDEKAENG